MYCMADGLFIETLADRSQIEVLRHKDSQQFLLLARGTADFIAEIGEIVGWLSAALRFNASDDLINCYAPCVVSSGQGGVLAGMAVHDIYHCEIGFDFVPDLDKGNPAGRCWFSMFRNPVVVHGFPILRRPRPNTGLEVPLDMAANLIDARQLHNFAGQLFLKGFSAMLTPVEAVGGVVLWHLSYNATGKRVSYLDAAPGSVTARPSISVLRSSRHVIGWCSDASYLAGECRAPSNVQQMLFVDH